MSEQLMAERYGVKAKHRPRWVRSLVVVLVLVLGLLVAYIAYRNLGADPISTEVKSFSASGQDTMNLTFTVTRDQADKAVDCIVTANLQDATELGRREVFIPSGDSSRTVTAAITTGTRAATGKVYGCSYTVPEYLGKTGPDR
ncbi:DUF4307 domain-containing protein [Sciscionella marina]|uniref:DUF4307 domain-containing protein n=1 Tax=Sciscionella marina TaxID=508770 RepID=UPI0012F6C4D1|nr:DUF4307 domain-containing protein [Sciscionella marina]